MHRHIYVGHAQCVTEKFMKMLWEGDKIQAVLEGLDRLTKDEARIAVAQTLGVVHGLLGIVKTVLEGAQSCMICSQMPF